MNDRLEKIKDILYDFSDYLVMGGIVLSIALIVGWRLDILFPKTVAMVNEDDTPQIEKEVDKNKDNTIEVADGEKDKSKKEDKEQEEVKKEEAKKEEDTEKTPEIIRVSIPKGTHSAGIGTILMDIGLIESTEDFKDVVEKLDLEKKLRSGEFDIAKGESLESIAKIIANQK